MIWFWSWYGRVEKQGVLFPQKRLQRMIYVSSRSFKEWFISFSMLLIIHNQKPTYINLYLKWTTSSSMCVYVYIFSMKKQQESDFVCSISTF